MGKLNKGGYLGGFDQLRAPDAPTIAVTAGNEQLSVAITAPTYTTGTIAYYCATAIAGGVSTGAEATSSPVTITGLTNGTTYTVSGVVKSEYGSSPSSDTTTTSPTSLNSRALFGGGYPNTNVIQQIEIATTGNATDFGDLSAQRSAPTATSSNTRGVFMGGSLSNQQKDIMEYVTIASAGNVTDFGDLSGARQAAAPISSSTRGIICGGDTSSNGQGGVNIMEYITIANTGNTTDFGNLDTNLMNLSGGQSTTPRPCTATVSIATCCF